MKKLIAYLLIVLGIAMIYIGGFGAPKLMLPPVITGIGFFAIAAIYLQEKN
jgi:hypothetical protein